MKKSNLLSSLLLACVASSLVACENQVGAAPATSVAKSGISTVTNESGQEYHVHLLPDTRSESEKAQDAVRIKSLSLQFKTQSLDLSSAKGPVYALGSREKEMNYVPVLNQGEHGTCATYSTTAALDALTSLDAGVPGDDTISQNCLLSTDLSSLFTGDLSNLYDPTQGLWEGSTPSIVLYATQAQGVLTKAACQKYFGVNPNDKLQATANNTMTASSEVFPYGMLTEQQYASAVKADKQSTAISNLISGYKSGGVITNARGTLLATLKAGIDRGHLLILSFSIFEDDEKKIVLSDKSTTFRCTPTDGVYVNQNICVNFADNQAGHGVVVVGYDDSKQRVIVRNSWTANMGDQGDFYISYDYLAMSKTNAVMELINN